jgi:hypothetical protein
MAALAEITALIDCRWKMLPMRLDIVEAADKKLCISHTKLMFYRRKTNPSSLSTQKANLKK